MWCTITYLPPAAVCVRVRVGCLETGLGIETTVSQSGHSLNSVWSLSSSHIPWFRLGFAVLVLMSLTESNRHSGRKIWSFQSL